MLGRGVLLSRIGCVVLVAMLAGCSPAPTAPTPGRGVSPGVGVGTGSPVGPLAADSLWTDVPVSSQLGGIGTIGSYTVFVPPAGFDRDASMQLVVKSDGALDVKLTPRSVNVLIRPTLVVDLAGLPGDAFGDWALYEWSVEKSEWVRLKDSMANPLTHRLSASIPGEGSYMAMPWSVATPSADTLVAAIAVTSLQQSVVSCGPTRLVVPAGALRGDGTIELRWDRRRNVVDLEVRPEELNQFEVPVMLTLDTSALRPADREGARVGWWNPTLERWEVVPGTVSDAEGHTVTAPLRHFSTYTVVLEGKAGWGSVPGPRMIID